jgi:uncharacterized protein with HEPN domain
VKEQIVYCQDLLSRIEQIQRFTAGGREAFMNSDLIQEAVVRCFEVIGEIVKRLDPNLKAQHPNLAWNGYAGFRDVLIHQYDKIMLPKVWQTVEDDLLPLKVAIEAILDSLNAQADTNESLEK